MDAKQPPNVQCSCGSGKKSKKCCGKAMHGNMKTEGKSAGNFLQQLENVGLSKGRLKVQISQAQNNKKMLKSLAEYLYFG